MRKFVLFGLALIAVAFVASPSFAQTNQQHFTDGGIDYFFLNGIVPPTDFTTNTRSFGSAASIGNSSGAGEGNVHQLGAQQDGFQIWNGQAGPGPGSPHPLATSLLQFRRGGTALQGTGTIIAQASWSTSLPCTAPWFWIVTFGWTTAFTETSSSVPGGQAFHFSVRGEVNQAINNQNYFTGSGNERNLNTGGISFLEDTLVGSAFQLIGRQEWSNSKHSLDALSVAGRDPSGGSTTVGFGLNFGTGGTIFRTASDTGANPTDGFSVQHEGQQQLALGVANSVLSLFSAPVIGGGLTANGTGSFTLAAGDGRTTNIKADPVVTGIALSVPILTKTGGALGGFTGDIGLSGTANTILFNLSSISVPPAFVGGIKIATQHVGVAIPFFATISNGETFTLR